MRQICGGLVIVLIALMFNSTQVRASDGHFYGVRSLEGTNSSEFLRYEIASGDWVVINSEVPGLDNPFSGSAVLDLRRQEYRVLSNSYELFRLDINTGELISSSPMPALAAEAQHNFVYDYTTDLVYTIENGNKPVLTGIDNTGQVVSRVEVQLSDEEFYYCSAFFDGPRGLYMIKTQRNTLVVIDVNTGIVLNKVQSSPRLWFEVYNQERGLLYGITSMNEGQPALESVDPLTDIRNRIPVSGMDFNKVSGGNCSGGFHTASNTYCFFTKFGVWQVNVLTGQAELMPNAPGDNLPEMELHNRVKELNIHLVKGSIYDDENENCRDDNEPIVGRIPVFLEPNGVRAYSNQNGEINIRLAEGQYTAVPQVKWPWRAACNDFGHRISVDENGLAFGNLDFGLYPEALVKHLQLSLGSDDAILGRQLQYRILAVNTGTVPFSGTLRFTFDPVLTGFQSTPAADLVNGQTAEWDVKDLPIGATFIVDAYLDVSSDESLRGMEICAAVDLAGEGPDLLAAQRRDVDCTVIRGSYDPNDMSVYPRGFGERGLVTQEDTTLAYTIRFQNIGSAPAFDVVIRDTLSDYLDDATLRFGASSHDYTVNLRAGKYLEFTFSDIMLPGKDENEAGSQGYVKFYADLHKNLPVDSEIRNSAAIYFDFNEPVITNTVLNTISESVTDVVNTPDSDELELRSLGNGLFVCRAERSLEGRLSVYSVLGSKVFEQSLTGQSQTVINLSHHPAGRYLVRVETGGKSVVRTVAVVH